MQDYERGPRSSGRVAAAASAVRLFNLDLVDADRNETAQKLVDLAAKGRRATIGFINAHCVNVAARDSRYRAALKSCDHLLPDGSGMRLAARLAGTSYRDNLNGTDLFPLICEEAARKGVSIYLLGGGEGIAEAAGRAMQRRYPDLNIAGTQNGYFEQYETARVIADINASGADMVFVGFGVPLQECWLADHGASIDAPVQLSVGGLFDYYSGRIPRAPMPIRKVGCEWIWRLAQEPRRLAGRYIAGNGIFIMHALAHAFAIRSGIDCGAALKRAGDLIAVTLGLALLAPLFAAIALAIRLEDGGPVFFSQTRIGKRGRPFKVLKFRSMVVNAEAIRARLLAQSDRDSICFKMKRDPRITRVGSLLRRTSLDELPQLFNVLLGDMSLVGPRPALPHEVTAYWQRALRRLDTRPGITCIWQVSGRAEIPFSQQVEMDIDYVESQGMMRDLGLLLRTIPAVVTARGAY
ncbi:WecB/TagA/CpsF family glycosyltransferase [Altererythrobacter aestuarii]|uniref:WecB/TagA/CpsF family glycosyltransferase n=2 Tax=Alteraurantiacibacter aestuarii TaxID=650004 RepID=A0A844ZLR9_9SPHN|nr:WecB/TagA/CpsF family glycosyltransferase [Alteraurantiacibacter aestuarii]